mgnify:CR=1 FL=1
MSYVLELTSIIGIMLYLTMFIFSPHSNSALVRHKRTFLADLIGKRPKILHFAFKKHFTQISTQEAFL